MIKLLTLILLLAFIVVAFSKVLSSVLIIHYDDDTQNEFPTSEELSQQEVNVRQAQLITNQNIVSE